MNAPNQNPKWYPRIVYYLRLTSYLMAILAALSLGRDFYLYGSNLSRIKLVVFAGWLIGTFIMFPMIDAVHKSLPNQKQFIRDIQRFNNEIILPCFTIGLFVFCSLTTWKAGDFGNQARPLLFNFFRLLKMIFQ